MRRSVVSSIAGRLAAALFLVVTPGFVALAEERTEDSRLSFEILFADQATGRLPSQLAWSTDGGRLSYVWTDETGEALWILDPSTGERRAVLRPDADGDEGLSVSASHWSPGGQELLLESAEGVNILRLEDLSLRSLVDEEGEVRTPAFSPTGERVAFVRDYDLYIVDSSGGTSRPLTTGGEEGKTLNGITDWVYWEEIWGRRTTGFWWGPEGRRIAYYQFDEEAVSTYPLVDFQGVPYPEVEWQKYPKAGTANPSVRIGVVDVESQETVWMDTGEATEVYLARVDWRPDGMLAIQRLDRDQTRLDLLLCDPFSGSCETLMTEQWPTWINLHEDLTFLEDGRFLTSSEESGWRRLYLHAADGSRLRSLSPDGWAVTSLDGVDEASGTYVFTAHEAAGLGAAERHVFTGRLEDGASSAMTSEGGWNTAQVAARGGRWLHRSSAARRPARISVRDLEGEELVELPGEGPSAFDPARLPKWEFLTVPGPDGVALPAAILLPPEPQRKEKLPAIMYHYGGPGSQVIANAWPSSGRGLWHELMAQRGYVVLKVDNAASRFFGKRGEDRLHRRFGEVNLAAQRAGVAYLDSLGFVDSSRIGLWGWSGGGSNTLYSVLNSPGTWRAAISGAPVTDWRLYDTIWTERYLDHPESNPEGYELSSAVTYAEKLEDALLIIHGTADDNVHPQNTLAMSRRLVGAGIPFEQAIYPRQKHGFRGGASRHLYERMTAFFDRHLLMPDVGE